MEANPKSLFERMRCFLMYETLFDQHREVPTCLYSEILLESSD